MTIDNAVLSFAGLVVLVGLVLGWQASPYFYQLSAFAGLNLVQAGITGFCPVTMIFKRLGLKPGCAFR